MIRLCWSIRKLQRWYKREQSRRRYTVSGNEESFYRRYSAVWQRERQEGEKCSISFLVCWPQGQWSWRQSCFWSMDFREVRLWQQISYYLYWALPVWQRCTRLQRPGNIRNRIRSTVQRSRGKRKSNTCPLRWYLREHRKKEQEGSGAWAVNWISIF